ncbi:MAG: fibronectin type III domain-containing protein [Lachnospiraceae bacterium]|nr:fibronectin type III domain-containing protein [Lachnospiraceae bacterium]
MNNKWFYGKKSHKSGRNKVSFIRFLSVSNTAIRLIGICFALLLLAGTFSLITNKPAVAGTIISAQRYYSSEDGCYIQVTTEIYSEYDADKGYNVNKRRITTKYYYGDSDDTFFDEKVTEEVLSYEPIEPETKPTGSPDITQPIVTPPGITAEPSCTPVCTATPAPMNTSAPDLMAKRNSGSKITVTWEEVENATGYIIYRSVRENKGYDKVKTIIGEDAVKYINRGLNSKKVYYYKVKAYQENGEIVTYTKSSKSCQVQTPAVNRIVQKLEQLKTKYKDGRYWNHVGYYVSKGQAVEGFVTKNPCSHKRRFTVGGKTLKNMGSKCNYYAYKLNNSNMLGYQCDGYATMLSDKIFGKTGFKSHKSYAKAKVGDCVRFRGHTALIIEKHEKYVVVTECNVGGTCVISWGRKISKKKLNNALYYTKY